MGIRVDKEALLDQLAKADAMDRLKLPFHQKVLTEEVPFSIGGGIGQSRVLMLLLGKKHIAEVQASAWQEKTEEKVKKLQIL
jgi:aspartate--ammonia ligase